MLNLTVRSPKSKSTCAQMGIPYIVAMLGLLTYYAPTAQTTKAFVLYLVFGLSFSLASWISTCKTSLGLVHIWAGVGVGAMMLNLLSLDGMPSPFVKALPLVGFLTMLLSILLQKNPYPHPSLKALPLFLGTCWIGLGLHYFSS